MISSKLCTKFTKFSTFRVIYNSNCKLFTIITKYQYIIYKILKLVYYLQVSKAREIIYKSPKNGKIIYNSEELEDYKLNVQNLLLFHKKQR